MSDKRRLYFLTSYFPLSRLLSHRNGGYLKMILKALTTLLLVLSFPATRADQPLADPVLGSTLVEGVFSYVAGQLC